MKFKEFKASVERWATERQIYTHSTANAQLLKTVSEIGELSDALIKSDYSGLLDAIGDVAVCLVNWAYMKGYKLIEPKAKIALHGRNANEAIGAMLEIIGSNLSETFYPLCDPTEENAQELMNWLVVLSETLNSCEQPFDFETCCSIAWREIKDRTGRMVAGGAFVKDGE